MGYVEDTDQYLDQSPGRISIQIQKDVQAFFAIHRLGTCFPVDVMYSLSREIVTKLVLYYKHVHFEINIIQDESSLWRWGSTKRETPKSNWPSWISHKVFALVQMDLDGIATFLQSETMHTILDRFTFCNVDAVMFCNMKQYNFLTTCIFFALVSLFVYYVINPTLGLICFMLIPVSAIYLSYQIAPACFPMIPTCWLDEIVWNIEKLIPPTLEFPPILLRNQTMRSCTEIGFQQYQDPAVYAACEMGLDEYISHYIQTDSMCILARDVTNRNGYRFCAFISSVLALPLGLAVIGIVFILLSFLMFCLSLIPSLLVVLYQIIVFNHREN